MQINQVNISYQLHEDRLLMRINSTDGAEIRLWLTRAVVEKMLTGFSQSERLLATNESHQVANPVLHRVLEEFDREASFHEGNVRAEFSTDATNYPLGQTPLLVVKLDSTPKGSYVSFVFALASGQSVTINLASRMIININNLLFDVLKRVDWNLPFLSVKRPLLRMPESETLH